VRVTQTRRATYNETAVWNITPMQSRSRQLMDNALLVELGGSGRMVGHSYKAQIDPAAPATS
jgi:hypothetical protein